MGFSQGAMLAWAVAVANPRAISASFPVSGFLFPEMLEKTGVEAARMPPIVAFHGDADPVVSVDEDRRGVRLLEKRGVRVDLRVYPGLGHGLTPGLRDDRSRRWRGRSRAEARPGSRPNFVAIDRRHRDIDVMGTPSR